MNLAPERVSHLAERLRLPALAARPPPSPRRPPPGSGDTQSSSSISSPPRPRPRGGARWRCSPRWPRCLSAAAWRTLTLPPSLRSRNNNCANWRVAPSSNGGRTSSSWGLRGPARPTVTLEAHSLERAARLEPARSGMTPKTHWPQVFWCPGPGYVCRSPAGAGLGPPCMAS